MQFKCSGNAVVKYLVSIELWCVYVLFLFFFFLPQFYCFYCFYYFTHVLWTFSVWNKTWLIDWLIRAYNISINSDTLGIRIFLTKQKSSIVVVVVVKAYRGY